MAEEGLPWDNPNPSPPSAPSPSTPTPPISTITDSPINLRLKLRRLGYSPIPTHGKEVFINGWPQLGEASEDDIIALSRKFRDHPDTGILTATTPALDLDILDAIIAEALGAN
jgi:hypothetical protein